MTVQVISDGRTVWINTSEGHCIGRFSLRGIDIHEDYVKHPNGPHCLHCKPGPTTYHDWLSFKEGMKKYYKINVAQKHMPKILGHKNSLRKE